MPYQQPKIETLQIEPELKGRGVFYDTHEMRRESGELAHAVSKEFHLDLLFSREAATEIFSRQEEEHKLLEKYFPPEMLPKSAFLVPKEFEDTFAKAKETSGPIYPYGKFFLIQMNRRFQGRYGLDERYAGREEKPMAKALKFMGDQIAKLKKSEKPTGVLIQERINGISFGEQLAREDLLEQPQYEALRENVRRLVSGLRAMHEKEERVAYTWHGLSSDNVMVELDAAGAPTGRVVIIDTNFIERPSVKWKKSVEEKLEQNVLQPLEAKFQI